MAENVYVPFRSKILEVIKHCDQEYTFRMSYDRGAEHPVKPGQFLKSLSLNMAKLLFPLAVLQTIPWILPSVVSAA